MATTKKLHARYFIVRGHQPMWRIDPAEPGSLFCEFVITFNEFTSTLGTFQVYGLEGASISRNLPHKDVASSVYPVERLTPVHPIRCMVLLRRFIPQLCLGNS